MTAPWQFYRPEFQRLSGIPGPAAPVVSLLSTWDAGEWSLAIEDLADNLSDRHTPLLRAGRAAILELATAFSVLPKAVSVTSAGVVY